VKRVGSLQAGDARIRHSRILYSIWRLDNTGLPAVRRLSLITTLPRRILPLMSSRGALAIAMLVAVVTQNAGICQLQCVGVGELSPSMLRGTGPPAPAPARHPCHAAAPAADTTIVGLAEACRHLSEVTAVLETTPVASITPVAHSSNPVVLHDSWLRASFARHARSRFGPPISSAGTLRV
jgi:hypothetical protein